MDNKTGLHTRISKENYNTLLFYGNGQLNIGISNIIKQISNKSIEISIITKINLNEN